MNNAFDAFMREIIDYAGLFPPARLELDPAVREYVHHQGGEHAWMLGRFIVTANRFVDLAMCGRDVSFLADLPIRACVILENGDTRDEALEAVVRGVDSIVAVFPDYRDAVVPDGLEVRFPLQTSEHGEHGRFLVSVRDAVESAGLGGLELFVETPPSEDWERDDRSAVEALAAFAGDYPDDPVLRRAGFKLRCGGLEPPAFPPVERIAAVLSDCRDQGVPVKFTAGLHHPVRSFAADPGVKQHGFLNVFGAGILARELNMTRADLVEVLEDEDAGAFRFDGERFLWRDRVVTAAQVARSRETFVTAFGSCSFDEPLSDLRSLGIIA